MAKRIKHNIIILAVVLVDVATRIFKYNPTLDEIFLTSDGQGFKEYEKAVDHSKYLGDKEIKTFRRSDLKADAKVIELHPVKEPENPKDDKEPEDLEESDSSEGVKGNIGDKGLSYKEYLIEEYTELYGKPPSHNIKTETLRARIAEAKDVAKSATKKEE